MYLCRIMEAHSEIIHPRCFSEGHATQLNMITLFVFVRNSTHIRGTQIFQKKLEATSKLWAQIG
jgi:hypothetical protein